MSQLDDLILKIPRPVLVLIVLVFALVFIIQQNPMSDGCEVEIENFSNQVKGVLIKKQNKLKKTQFPKLYFQKDRCKEENSQGTCLDYFRSLKLIADSMAPLSDKCYPKFQEEFPNVVNDLAVGIRIMALSAWGEKAPENITQRLGWLTEIDIYTFCRVKSRLIKLTNIDEFKTLRASIYKEFPRDWPDTIPIEKRALLPRPRALKTESNPNGIYTEDEIYPRSLFSLRCDLYQ